MKKEMSEKYIFENDILCFESNVEGFSTEIYNDFDSKAKKINLNSKINKLLEGKVVNLTENQAAIHPMYRNYLGKEEGQIPHNLSNAPTVAKNFYNKWKKQSKLSNGDETITIFTLGIGGSYEGPKLLLECFDSPYGYNDVENINLNFDFITGSDPKEFLKKTKDLNPKNTFFIVSSKSFTTHETIENLKKALAWSMHQEHFIAITSKPEEAKKYGIREIITFAKEIGGRYSIWSPITQFHLQDGSPLVKENEEKRKNFFRGGLKADYDINSNEKYQEFVKRISFSDIWLNNTKQKNVRTILSYEWNLRSLPDYFQQLEMESLGKQANPDSEFKKTGQTIFGGFGPTAQHSYFQLLHQGTQEISADIIASKEDLQSLSYAQAITQSKLLSNTTKHLKNEERINANVPVNLFLINKLDPYSLGYLIATWEHRVFITASMLGINPFDQFGVQAAKSRTIKFLKDD